MAEEKDKTEKNKKESQEKNLNKKNSETQKKELDKKETGKPAKDSDDKTKDKENNPEKNASSNDPDYYNKVLRNFLLLIGGVIFLIIFIYIIIQIPKTFEYKGVEFTEYEKGDLLLYKTKFPVFNSQGEKTANHNIYLRENPDKTKKVEFDGDFSFKSNLVINFSENFDSELNCVGEQKGDNVIAISTFVEFFQNTGTKVVRDPNATCDPQGRYILVNLKAGADETMIKEKSENCYDIYIKDCEILKGTERFLYEGLAELQEIKESNQEE